ncbi:MAG: hypothetical protein ING73_12640 [Rhodocyclaceae bacterium]|jgi:hypothetical protein|nr:hypothetical protein [Rhodocyclaceae bacterium]MCA3031492.1 hypothetical protein [Rhodocyclaceae bacterium]MCA3036209.1 hypothetical protein [Rhodocyclaceae bacterium]MCA3046616.1 hypothetical protein [Rhodocyclaceae bacterium]MCA3050625.1 hypothetical protein [Rhodocyclaceae bacterium]
MNQPIKTKFTRELLWPVIVAIAALAWGVSKLSEPTISNVVGGIGWIVGGCSAAAWVVMSVRKVTHELAWKTQKIANYMFFAIVLIAIFLPRSEL